MMTRNETTFRVVWPADINDIARAPSRLGLEGSDSWIPRMTYLGMTNGSNGTRTLAGRPLFCPLA
jgi:hypothetical protein